MIPYELIVTSASRPHLLRQSIASALRYIDQEPKRVLVHDDAVVPDQSRDIDAAMRWALPSSLDAVLLTAEPPVLHGLAIHRLLCIAATDYVLYLDDDAPPLRSVPIQDALATMEEHGLNAIRFNKRQTMAIHSGWPKVQRYFTIRDGHVVILTLAEKLHFQFGLWRRSWVKAATDWWQAEYPGSLAEHGEVKINNALSGVIPEFRATGLVSVPQPGCHDDHAARIAHCRTYIWGPIGEPAFLDHIGWRQEDWRDNRTNRSGNELQMRLAEEQRTERT